MFRLWQYGQSNMVWLNNTTPGSPTNDTMLPLLRQLIDPTGAEASLGVQYDLTGTAFSGIGVAFSNATATAGADFYYGVAADAQLTRPAAPADTARFQDWANWPLTSSGASRIAYAQALPAATKAEIAAIMFMHSEYDSNGYKSNSWAAGDPRVVEFSQRRMIGALRAALGKTAADLPVLAAIAIPYSPSPGDGVDLVNRAIRTLAADPAFNLQIVVEQTMDMTWDRDGPAGSYTWHAGNDDLALLCRRFARGIARAMGPKWAPNSFRSRPDIGPCAIWAQRVDDSTVDVWVKHDGGNALTLPATPALGWAAQYNGRAVAVTGAAVQADQRRIRLTLASPCPAFPLLSVSYGWGNVRLLPGGGVYDNSASFDPKATAAAVTGADRINGALRRTPTRLAVQASAPPSTL